MGESSKLVVLCTSDVDHARGGEGRQIPSKWGGGIWRNRSILRRVWGGGFGGVLGGRNRSGGGEKSEWGWRGFGGVGGGRNRSGGGKKSESHGSWWGFVGGWWEFVGSWWGFGGGWCGVWGGGRWGEAIVVMDSVTIVRLSTTAIL